jgi:hypothetical protein
MWHGWGRGEVHTEFWLGILKERNHLEEIGVDVRIILNWIGVGTGLIWLKTGQVTG